MTMKVRDPLRRLWLAQAGAATLAAAAGTARGQARPAWPTRALRLLAPFAPDEGARIVARAVALEMSRTLGQNVEPEHLPGAAGAIAMQEAARPGDGHTLVLGHIGTLVVSPGLFPTPPYDAQKDFAPVALLAKVPSLYVAHPDLPVRALQDLVAHARAHPGRLSYGSAGIGSAGHLAMESLKTASGTFMLHLPYRDGDLLLADLLAGRVDLAAADAPALLPLIRAGRLRCLAAGAAARLPLLPDVATVAEQGYPGFEMTQWYGLLAPRQWPRTQVWTLEAHAIRAVRSARVREQLAARAITSMGTTGAEFDAFIQAERARWQPVIARARLRPEGA